MADTDTKIQPYVLLAKGARGRALEDLIARATSEPGLFGFSELMQVPNVQEISVGPHAPHHRLLELFAYGTWPDYTAAPAGHLPQLSPAQTNKLKQLTVMSLALQQKVLPYSVLQQQLGIPSVRGLEDFIITECVYQGILTGKLDPRNSCLQVHSVQGRDVHPSQLPVLQQGINTWLQSAEDLLARIEGCVNDASVMVAAAAAKKAAEAAEEENMRKVIKVELDARGPELYLDESGPQGSGSSALEEDRADRLPMAHERGERREKSLAARSKKRLQR